MISNHFCESVGGPEKAGVGGSIPSLATNIFNNLAAVKKRVKLSERAQYAHIGCFKFHFWRLTFKELPNSPCAAGFDDMAC